MYFITHIPISISLDFQALFGDFYSQGFKDINTYYVKTYNDPLMATTPIWFKSFIACEVIFQLPFFFIASYALLYEQKWIRIPMIIYGTHVSTTLVPILAEFLFSKTNTTTEKAILFSFYLPYFIIPLLLAIVFGVYENPFEKQGGVRGQRKKAN